MQIVQTVTLYVPPRALTRSPDRRPGMASARAPNRWLHRRVAALARGHAGQRGSRASSPTALPAGGTRPPKYGPHSREVIAARRYGTSRHHRGHPNGRNPGDVWAINTRPYHGPHFAAFPIELPLRCIAAGCKPGGMVLDMFCGTGTTGIAARQLGRQFTGIELNPAFAALAAERLRHAVRAQPDGTQPERSGNEPEPDGTEGGSR